MHRKKRKLPPQKKPSAAARFAAIAPDVEPEDLKQTSAKANVTNLRLVSGEKPEPSSGRITEEKQMDTSKNSNAVQDKGMFSSSEDANAKRDAAVQPSAQEMQKKEAVSAERSVMTKSAESSLSKIKEEEVQKSTVEAHPTQAVEAASLYEEKTGKEQGAHFRWTLRKAAVCGMILALFCLAEGIYIFQLRDRLAHQGEDMQEQIRVLDAKNKELEEKLQSREDAVQQLMQQITDITAAYDALIKTGSDGETTKNLENLEEALQRMQSSEVISNDSTENTPTP